MVEATGLEPAASCSQSKRATKLRHASLCNCVCLIYRGTKVALVALLRFPKFLCALERHRNFDRYAISPSLYLPPAAVRLNAQIKRATKLRHASLCIFQLSVVYITLLFLSTDYGKFKTDVFTFRTHLFSSFIQSLFLSENFRNFIRGNLKLF